MLWTRIENNPNISEIIKIKKAKSPSFQFFLIRIGKRSPKFINTILFKILQKSNAKELDLFLQELRRTDFIHPFEYSELPKHINLSSHIRKLFTKESTVFSEFFKKELDKKLCLLAQYFTFRALFDFELGEPILQQALPRKLWNVANELIKADLVDVSAIFNDGKTTLIMCCESAETPFELIKTLINHPKIITSIYYTFGKINALTGAIYIQRMEVIQLLLHKFPLLAQITIPNQIYAFVEGITQKSPLPEEIVVKLIQFTIPIFHFHPSKNLNVILFGLAKLNYLNAFRLILELGNQHLSFKGNPEEHSTIGYLIKNIDSEANLDLLDKFMQQSYVKPFSSACFYIAVENGEIPVLEKPICKSVRTPSPQRGVPPLRRG